MSKYFTVRRLTILALLTALCHIGRIAFQFLPNVQPVTAIIIIITLTMGTIDGIIVASTSMLLSNILLGTGPWTIYQILSFSIIVLIFGLLRKGYQGMESRPFLRRLLFSIVSGAAGLLYGFVISFLSAQLFGMANFWVYYIQGLSFDLMHMVGNIIFFAILEPTLGPIINKYLNR